MCVGQLYDTADLLLQCNRDSVRVIHDPRAAHSKAVNNSQAMSTRMVHMAGCSALGKGREQQPGARLTMACFTPPSWHMAASKIVATGHCQRKPTR